MRRIALLGQHLAGAVAARLIAEGYKVVDGDREVILTDGIGAPHIREIEEAVLASRAYEAKEAPVEAYYPGAPRKSQAEKLERKKRIQALQNGAFNKKRRKQG